jgi:DNA-binding XRE family transcriptional regulator
VPDFISNPADPFELLVANVLTLRAQGNWSTRALAEQARVSPGSVRSFDRGHSKTLLRIADRLARALGVKTGSLFGKRFIAREDGDGLIEVVLAQNLIAARKNLLHTQDTLSQQSGVARTVIAHMER